MKNGYLLLSTKRKFFSVSQFMEAEKNGSRSAPSFDPLHFGSNFQSIQFVVNRVF